MSRIGGRSGWDLGRGVVAVRMAKCYPIKISSTVAF